MRLSLALAIALAASCGGPTEPPAVASLTIQPDSVSLMVGSVTQLSATTKDAAGVTLTGRTITWTSSDPARATVSTNGVVSAVSAGRVEITATSEGKAGIGVVAVQLGDFSIENAQFTQGVQAADGSVPVVLNGGAAVVNVLVRATSGTSTAMKLVLRLFAPGAGAPFRTDTAVTTGQIGVSPIFAAPTAQFLVPATAVQAGLEWQIVRDPTGLVPDDTAANDVFPRTGRRVLATATVPVLTIRFVPIVLSSHNNATGQVSSGTMTEYLRTLKTLHPVGVVNTVIGTPLSTTASFGTPPSGGSEPFWQQVLQELDVARVADGSNPQAHWYGVVLPPAGFNFTNFGGFAYIPFTYSTGAGSRTAVAVQVGWFNRQSAARELVAHELGHNFGRRHAPCGGPASPDPNFPNAGGVIGLAGHDVYSWSAGLASNAVVQPASAGDIMGYCPPPWSSEYTWRGIFQFRQPPTSAPPVERVLVVRGRVGDRRGVSLDPVFVVYARPSAPERSGPYHLEGRGADGTLLFSRDFTPATLDHAPDLHHFTFTIPATAGLEESLATIEVRGPAGAARADRSPAVLSAGPVSAAPGAGGATIVCPDPAARGILVQATDGTVLGMASAASLTLLVAAGTALSVQCSDGVRTVASRAVAP